MLRFYRDAVADAPDELEVFAGAASSRPTATGTRLAAMIVCHSGDPEQAERDLAPLIGWGSPLVVQVGEMPYPDMNRILDDGFPTGLAQLLAVGGHPPTACRMP